MKKRNGEATCLDGGVVDGEKRDKTTIVLFLKKRNEKRFPVALE